MIFGFMRRMQCDLRARSLGVAGALDPGGCPQRLRRGNRVGAGSARGVDDGDERTPSRELAIALQPDEPMRTRTVESPTGVGELGNRLTVAAIGLPVVVVLLASDARASAWLFAAAAGIACWEYCRLTLGRMEPIAWIAVVVAALLPLLPAYLDAAVVGSALFLAVATTSMLAWTVELFGASRASAPGRVGHVISGLLFCSVGMVALSALRSGPDGVAWAALVLVATWTNDALAYFFGRVFGRHKLFPAVSPKKSWEGLVAGFLGGLLGVLVIRHWLPRYMDVPFCLAAGTVAGLVAPVGDLCKSMLKRAYHVKDASHLLPGHGGVLDRIDGLLFVAPFVWLLRAALLRR
jgi:phosphatidate cytidylyltransferase